MQSFDERSCGLCVHFKQRIPKLSDPSEDDSLTIMEIVNSGTCSIDHEAVGYADHGCAFHEPVFEISNA